MSEKKNNQARHAKLSLSMIIKNEEKLLEGCLESVQGVVDEIIIVDTGSTDHSREIAQRWGARLFDFQWIGDFAVARNYSLQQCSGDWVLYLDADERLSNGHGNDLRNLLSERNVGAYNIVIDNPHSLQQGHFNQENSYPRLFRRLPGVKFEGKVHEQVWPSLMRHKVIVKQSSVVIHHLGYAQGYDVVRQKAERNLELLRNQSAESPDDAYAQFQIGNSLVVLQRYDEAAPVLEAAIANTRLHVSNRASCYNLLAEVEVKRNNVARAVECCMKSLEVAPRQVMAHWFLSLMYYDMQEFGSAIDMLQKVRRLVDVSPANNLHQVAFDLNLMQEDVDKRLALTYEAGGQFARAMEQYALLFGRSSNGDEALAGFLRSVEKLGNSNAVRTWLKELEKTRPESAALYLPLALHYRKLNDRAAALELIGRAIRSRPVNAEAYVLALRWHMESGDTIEAEEILSAAGSANVRTLELHKLGMQLSLQKGDINSAFHHLELMASTTDADLTPLRNRIAAIAKRLSSLSLS